jgi:hypothetical protein
MSDAPERIWADGNAEWDSGSWGRSKEFDNDVEYVRADRIEELDKACKEWAEVSQRNYQRAKTAEAKLAKAVEALDDTRLVLAEYEPHPLPVLRKVLTTLAELKGETDA